MYIYLPGECRITYEVLSLLPAHHFVPDCLALDGFPLRYNLADDLAVQFCHLYLDYRVTFLDIIKKMIIT